MRTFQLIAAVLLVVLGCDAWILQTEPLLPARVVTKWTNGIATHFMTRDEWIAAAIAMVSIVGIVLACAAALAEHLPRKVRFAAVALTPAAEAWLRERRALALYVLAGLHVLWMTWFHWIVLQANRLQPAELSATPITVWVGTQLTVVMGFVAYMFYTTLRAPRLHR